MNQEAALVTQAEQDHANGVLKGNKRHDFYENYRTLLQQITNEMEKSLTPQELQLLKSCKACQNMKSSRNDESSPNVRDGATGVRFHPKMLLV